MHAVNTHVNNNMDIYIYMYDCTLHVCTVLVFECIPCTCTCSTLKYKYCTYCTTCVHISYVYVLVLECVMHRCNIVRLHGIHSKHTYVQCTRKVHTMDMCIHVWMYAPKSVCPLYYNNLSSICSIHVPA